MSKTRIQIAKPDIVRHFDEQPSRVYKFREIAAVLSEQRRFWRLAQATNTTNFIDFLIKNSKLRKFEFKFPQRPETCYAWDAVSSYDVLMHIREYVHFSHYTAVKIHGLTEQEPKSIYLTHERGTPSVNTSSAITQEQIDQAFHRPARASQNWTEYDNKRIYLLNGVHTDNLGVVRKILVGETEARVLVTDIERTLIDIVVRPSYAGGIFEVAKAFELAKDQVSINKLTAMLQKLRFVYPYHQAIGYYIERAGYRASQIDLLRRLPIEHKFYLTNDISEGSLVKDWKLFVPNGFDLLH